MARKRVTYRPNKASGVVGGIAGGLFVLIGLFVVIPTFGPFGMIWTLFAAVVMVSNLYQAFGKRYVGPEIHIEEEPSYGEGGAVASVEQRLEELKSLYDRDLITYDEYEAKRKEILQDL